MDKLAKRKPGPIQRRFEFDYERHEIGKGDQRTLESHANVICKEAELIGSSDHLAQEMPMLIELARRGTLDLSNVVTGTLPLDADAINEALDGLDSFGGDVRLVITP